MSAEPPVPCIYTSSGHLLLLGWAASGVAPLMYQIPDDGD